MPSSRTDITIVSDDNPVKGWLYRPEPSPSPEVPIVVMAHGFSGVKEMALADFAELIADAGIAVVVFDHPCFGASGGTPRQEVDPDRQLRAYRDAITWASGIEGLDGERVGVWGTSFSGGHAVVLAATDPRVKAAVAQVPYLGSPLEDIPEDLALILLADDERVGKGNDPLMIPVVTPEIDGGGALSVDADAYPWFTTWGVDAPSWRNEVTLKSIARLIAYRPLEHCANVHAPVLLIGAREDVLAPFDLDLRAHALMPDDCDLIEVGGGHFAVYGELFGLASEAAAGWFTRWLEP